MLTPEAVFLGTKARSRLDELERAHDPAAVVRVDDAGGRGIAFGQERVGLLAADPVVKALQPLALPGCRRRRQLELGQGGTEVEAGSTDDDRHPAVGEDLVDRSVRESLVLGHRSLLGQVEEPDQPDRELRLVGQER